MPDFQFFMIYFMNGLYGVLMFLFTFFQGLKLYESINPQNLKLTFLWNLSTSNKPTILRLYDRTHITCT